MFLSTAPDIRSVQRFLEARVNDGFSYPEIGGTLTSAPAGYNVDHNRVKVGTGQSAFDRAKSAVRGWKMFEMPWIQLVSAETPIEAGKTVAIACRHFGFYSLNAARIVYVIDEVGDIERFGFAYGTLREHAEVGEERFSVEFDKASNEVWYDLLAFSRPGSALARIGYPLSRHLQKAFARDSKLAMLRAVSDDLTPPDVYRIVLK
jgi:uncharacterized protein (UPF0548 family)